MIAIGCDHGGFNLKQTVMKKLEEMGETHSRCMRTAALLSGCSRQIASDLRRQVGLEVWKKAGLPLSVCI